MAVRRHWLIAALAAVVCLAVVVPAAGAARSDRNSRDRARPTASATTSAKPTTSAPTTSAPTTSAPTTSAPTTSAPTTSAPTTSAPTTSAPTEAVPGAGAGVLPPVPARADYQLGGAYDPDPSVGIVVRDRTAKPAAGLYSICYVNAYQTQPGEAGLWSGANADLVLRDAKGNPVVDDEWDEMILDTSTAAKRQRLADIVGSWIDGCAAAGYQAVELDNLDTWTRSGKRLTSADNLAYASLLINRAHGRGMVVAQKNAAELGSQGKAAGFDFAVAEDCQVWSECNAYTKVYSAVIEVEYTDKGFNTACAARGSTVSIQRRDMDLVPRGKRGYVAKWC